jgi:large subunit ribosomal protein L22
MSGVKAIAKGVSMSPRKVGVVAGLVRGRTVADALVILSHVPRAAGTPVRKAIESAKANADYNHNYKPETLRITEISVTPGPRMKRYFPAARGMARPYQKKSSHILVIVDGEKRTPKKPAVTKAEAKKETK